LSPCAKSNFSHFSYGVSATAGSPSFSFHSVSFTHRTHSKIVSFLVPLKSTNLLLPFAFSPFISSAIATSFKSYRNPPSQFVPHSLFFPFPSPIKNLRQSLVQLAEVIPTSSGRSPYPPSAQTRGRLAHSVHPPFLRFLSMLPHFISLFRNPHGSISFFQRWL
jgi:hypothetical protein